MYRRNVRFIALITILVMVTVFAWACGDDEVVLPQTPPDLPSGEVQPQTPSESESTRPHAGTHQLIGEKLRLEDTDVYPEDFTDAFESKPIVLCFYVPGGSEDERVYDSLRTLKRSFAKYEFLMYEYASSDLYEDLSTILDVGYPPHIVLIDETGVVAEVWNGYVDQGSLNQGLIDLGVTDW